jgi:hypothetical protein
VRDGGRERAGLRVERGGSWERKAVGGHLIEVSKDMVAKARREEAGSWETGNRGWEQADLTETHANPATRMDCIIVEGRRGWAHVKAPGVGAEA